MSYTKFNPPHLNPPKPQPSSLPSIPGKTIAPSKPSSKFEQAQSAAIQANLTEPRAIAAYYDSAAELVIIRLQSGAIFSFPPAIAQGLAGAEAGALAQVEVTLMGDGLHWETLDADFSLVGLLAGVFGTKRWMADLQQQWSQQQAS